MGGGRSPSDPDRDRTRRFDTGGQDSNEGREIVEAEVVESSVEPAGAGPGLPATPPGSPPSGQPEPERKRSPLALVFVALLVAVLLALVVAIVLLLTLLNRTNQQTAEPEPTATATVEVTVPITTPPDDQTPPADQTPPDEPTPTDDGQPGGGWVSFTSGSYALVNDTALDLDLDPVRTDPNDTSNGDFYATFVADTGTFYANDSAVIAAWQDEREPTAEQCAEATSTGGAAEQNIIDYDSSASEPTFQMTGVCVRTSEDRIAWLSLEDVNPSTHSGFVDGAGGSVEVWD